MNNVLKNEQWSQTVLIFNASTNPIASIRFFLVTNIMLIRVELDSDRLSKISRSNVVNKKIKKTWLRRENTYFVE